MSMQGNRWGKGSPEWNRWMGGNPWEKGADDSGSITDRTNLTERSLVWDDGKGWMNVRSETGKIIQIAKYTRVNYYGFNEDNSREKFKIKDWPNEGVVASVAAISRFRSRFMKLEYHAGASLRFEKNNFRLYLNDGSWVHAATDSSNPIPNGRHNIWLPDYLHTFGELYQDVADYATVWFRLGSESSSRYLHVGRISAGCVTVGEEDSGGTENDRKKWDEIYASLIQSRIGNKYVGNLEVT